MSRHRICALPVNLVVSETETAIIEPRVYLISARGHFQTFNQDNQCFNTHKSIQ